MFSVIFFKVAAELALYYSLFAVTPTLLELSLPPFIMIGLLSLAMLTASFLKSKQKRELRYLGLIFVVIAFFLSLNTFTDLFSVIPPCLYVTYIIHKGNFDLDPLDVRKEFRISLLGAGILFFVLLVMDWFSEMGLQEFLPTIAEKRINLIVPEEMIKYLLLFIVMMALAVRQVRYDSDYYKGYNLMQWIEAGVILVPAVIAIVLIVNFGPPILTKGANALGEVISEIRFERDSDTYFEWKRWTGRRNDISRKELDEVNKEQQGKEDNGEVWHYDGHADKDVDSHFGQENLEIIWPYMDILSNPLLLFGIFIGIVLIVVAIALIRSTRRLTFKKRIKTNYNIRDVRDDDAFKKKNKVKVFSNRAKVRRVYCDFLDIIRKNGITLNNRMTSEEVYEKIRTVFDDESAKALRNVYIKARYDDFSDVTNDEVRDAKQALNGIKKLS